VGGHRKIQNDTVLPPILRHVPDAERDGVRWRLDAHARTVDQDLARVRRPEAEQDLGQLGASRAYESCESENLAARDGQRDTRDPARPMADTSELEHRRAASRLMRTWGIDGRQLASDHQPDQFGAADV